MLFFAHSELFAELPDDLMAELDAECGEAHDAGKMKEAAMCAMKVFEGAYDTADADTQV